MGNVHVILREAYFVDCPSVSFGFAIPDREERVKGMDVKDLYRSVWISASILEFEDD